MPKLNLLILFLALLFLQPALRANDTAGMILPTGNIIFTKQPDIQMQAEALYLRPERIEVNYLFKNTSDKDITETIFFPLPPLDALENPAGYDGNNMNFNFKCFIDGKEQPVQTYFIIKAAGADITKYVKDLFPEYYSQVSYTDLDKYLSKLPQKELDALEQAGAIEYGYIDFDDEDLKGWTQKEPWQKDISFSWKQVFPAGKTLHIKHIYKPSNFINSILTANSQCIDTQSEQYKAFAEYNEDGYKYGSTNYFEYILKTAANWQMPMASFNLLIEAPAKTAGCFDGKAFFSSGRYFARNLTDYTPAHNLSADFFSEQNTTQYKAPAFAPALYKIDGPATLRNAPGGKKIGIIENASYAWVIMQNKDWYKIIQNDSEGWTYKDNLINIFKP